MKYWLDTEFIERPYSIDLISVGLVAEDGREFYAESKKSTGAYRGSTLKPSAATAWPGDAAGGHGYAVRRFVEHDEHPVFWGYFPAYDWVAFTWLFGDMNEVPFHFAQLCLDVKQWAIELGDPSCRIGGRTRTRNSPSAVDQTAWPSCRHS